MKNRNMILRICACTLVVLMLTAVLTSCSGGGKSFFERYFGSDYSDDGSYYPDSNYPSFGVPNYGTESCEHDWVEQYVVEEATSNSDGIKHYRCSNCYSEKNEYYSLGALTGEEIYDLGERSFCEIVAMDREGYIISVGSGFVYGENGEILTNYHVIDCAYQIMVYNNGSSYTVSNIIYTDVQRDVALLRIDAYGLEAVSVNTDSARAGAKVYSIGNPLNYGISITEGIVSYPSRYVDGYYYIQHDSAISGGNSGGPLYNEYGEVIGMNTMTDYDGQNINFAIPMYEIANYIDYSNEMSVSDYYDRYNTPVSILSKYAMNYGDYDGKAYSLYIGQDYYSNNYNVYYYDKYVRFDPYNNLVMLVAYFDGNEFILYLNDSGYSYDWELNRYDGYYMTGYVYANSFAEAVSTLSYYDYNGDPTNSRRMAASALHAILYYMSDNLCNFGGIVPSDLGFVYF